MLVQFRTDFLIKIESNPGVYSGGNLGAKAAHDGLVVCGVCRCSIGSGSLIRLSTQSASGISRRMMTTLRLATLLASPFALICLSNSGARKTSLYGRHL